MPKPSKNQRYDVAIVSVVTGRIDTIIGKGMDMAHAEKRERTGISRINGNYFVTTLPAGKYEVGDKPKGE